MVQNKKLVKPKKPEKINPLELETPFSCPVLENLTKDIQMNIAYLKEHFKDCSDVIYRALTINNQLIYAIYTDGMIDTKLLTNGVFKGLLRNSHLFSQPSSLVEEIKNSLPVGQISIITNTNEIITKILGGNIVILLQGSEQALAITLPGWQHRGIATAEIEPTIRGPKESFTETLNINISLIRRRLLHPDCKVHNLTLGTYSQTRVSVLYISSIVNDKLLKELLARLDRIKIDSVLEVNYIEELIEDAPFSIFPKVQSTERPDKAVTSLLEGRIIILQENDPFALIVPALFMDFFQSPEDYFERFWLGSFIRTLRYTSIFIAVMLPALFIALITYNQELLPTKLIISIAQQREGVPFPAAIEAILMGLIFEILREAGTRLPIPIGQTVSIVGAIIIGESAVTAGLISPAMVIVTALTAIATFTVPSIEINDPILFIRVFLTLLSAFLGFWGIFIGMLLILGHLASLRSLGIPYLTPLAPIQIKDLEDILIRSPIWKMDNRPSFLNRKNFRRQKKNSKPGIKKG